MVGGEQSQGPQGRPRPLILIIPLEKAWTAASRLAALEAKRLMFHHDEVKDHPARDGKWQFNQGEWNDYLNHIALIYRGLKPKATGVAAKKIQEASDLLNQAREMDDPEKVRVTGQGLADMALGTLHEVISHMTPRRPA